MKKIIAAILTLALICTFSTAAFAATNLTINAESKTAKAGDTVEIPVKLTANTGFMYMKLRVVYDTDNLELVSITNGTAATGAFSTEGNAVLWDSPSDEKATGLLATVTLKVKDTASAGEYTVGISFIEAWNENEDDLTADVSNGKITIPGSTDPTPDPVTGESKDVVANYQEGVSADTVYSVDIVWGSMEFTYTGAGEGTWNPDTHTFSGGTAAGWSCETNANKVTLTNHSNAAVTATLSYTPGTNYSGITGNFTESSGTVNDAVLELATADGTTVANAPTAQAYLQLTGALASSVTSKTVLGTATVTLN